jgi:hypothetical protein
MNAPHAALAVAALTGKVPRLRASAVSQPRGAARKRERADGPERLAPRVAHGPAEVRWRLDPPMGLGISPHARKHAGSEIHALARKRQSQGTEHNALARVRVGWGRGGDDHGASFGQVWPCIHLGDITGKVVCEWAALQRDGRCQAQPDRASAD